ncbi:hypothetical protein OC835_005217 [Tilletia horrida]|nr:hypothetical protein OC835_005217 [Tilletia horrida]KAK0561351.1 hypothetical protein OC844_003263 [Tilletia horrida]
MKWLLLTIFLAFGLVTTSQALPVLKNALLYEQEPIPIGHATQESTSTSPHRLKLLNAKVWEPHVAPDDPWKPAEPPKPLHVVHRYPAQLVKQPGLVPTASSSPPSTGDKDAPRAPALARRALPLEGIPPGMLGTLMSASVTVPLLYMTSAM